MVYLRTEPLANFTAGSVSSDEVTSSSGKEPSSYRGQLMLDPTFDFRYSDGITEMVNLSAYHSRYDGINAWTGSQKAYICLAMRAFCLHQ
jgi:hypothetical protein